MSARSSRVEQSSSATNKVAGADLGAGGSEPRALPPAAGSPGRSEGRARGGRSEADTTGEAYRRNPIFVQDRSTPTRRFHPVPGAFRRRHRRRCTGKGARIQSNPCRSKSVLDVRSSSADTVTPTLRVSLALASTLPDHPSAASQPPEGSFALGAARARAMSGSNPHAARRLDRQVPPVLLAQSGLADENPTARFGKERCGFCAPPHEARRPSGARAKDRIGSRGARIVERRDAARVDFNRTAGVPEQPPPRRSQTRRHDRCAAGEQRSRPPGHRPVGAARARGDERALYARFEDVDERGRVARCECACERRRRFDPRRPHRVERRHRASVGRGHRFAKGESGDEDRRARRELDAALEPREVRRSGRGVVENGRRGEAVPCAHRTDGAPDAERDARPPRGSFARAATAARGNRAHARPEDRPIRRAKHHFARRAVVGPCRFVEHERRRPGARSADRVDVPRHRAAARLRVRTVRVDREQIRSQVIPSQTLRGARRPKSRQQLEAALHVGRRGEIELVVFGAVLPGNVHPFADEQPVAAPPGDAWRNDPGPRRRAQPEPRQDEDGRPRNPQAGSGEKKIGGRRDDASLETDRHRWIGTWAEHHVARALHFDAARRASQRERRARQSKALVRDHDVAAQDELAKPPVSLDFVGRKRELRFLFWLRRRGLRPAFWLSRRGLRPGLGFGRRCLRPAFGFGQRGAGIERQETAARRREPPLSLRRLTHSSVFGDRQLKVRGDRRHWGTVRRRVASRRARRPARRPNRRLSKLGPSAGRREEARKDREPVGSRPAESRFRGARCRCRRPPLGASARPPCEDR